MNNSELYTLRFYKVNCKLIDETFTEKGTIACELDEGIIIKRLQGSDKVESFEVEEINKDEVVFPVTLMGINQKYYSWEDLVKDFMIGKISGVLNE